MLRGRDGTLCGVSVDGKIMGTCLRAYNYVVFVLKELDREEEECCCKAASGRRVSGEVSSLVNVRSL